MNCNIDFNTAPDHLLLTATETAEFLAVSPITLQDWRYRRIGPAYVKVGKSVRYRLGALRLWIANQTIEPNAATN